MLPWLAVQELPHTIGHINPVPSTYEQFRASTICFDLDARGTGGREVAIMVTDKSTLHRGKVGDGSLEKPKPQYRSHRSCSPHSAHQDPHP